MGTNFTRKRRLSLFVISFFLFPLIPGNNGLFAQTNVGTATGVATFQCVGIYWSASGGSASIVCNVKYRVAGSGAAWKNGYPLNFDTRAVGGRPANEYRGSIINLAPATAYEIELSAGTAINNFTCTTWSETFPVASTQTVSSSSATLNITTGGTAAGYVLYTPATGNTATINVNNASTNCVYINAPYVILRGLILQGAKVDAIKLGPNAHDVVIENNDISNWGTVLSNGFGQNMDAGIRVANQSAVSKIIIQRNKIHHPRTNSNSWEQNNSAYGTNHPMGPQAISFETAGGNHVIRYNEIYSDDAHHFNDGIGGGENFSYEGFPRANSDIYGNKISQTWDDGIESEGGNCNVRIWGNYLDSTYVKIAIAVASVGPIYIFRNVGNVSRRSSATGSTADAEERGPFIKAGSQDAQYRGGKVFIFHNTLLQPAVSGYSLPLGCGGGILDDAGGPMTPVVSRNNILHIWKPSWQSVGDNFSSQTSNSFDYDLYNGNIVAAGSQETHGWSGTPVYSTTGIANGWQLATTSKGANTATLLNNFNDGFLGSGPDAGAYEAGAPPLQFGVNAYNSAPPPPPPTTNQPPVANAGNDITVTLPANTVLNGTGSTDPNGNNTIVSYHWSKFNPVNSAITIVSPDSVSTLLTGLTQGPHVFRLTVTDAGGLSSTDEVTVTVNPAPNQPPTANAGSDGIITLPLTFTSLLGSGSDPDGTIASYVWSIVSAPAGTNPTFSPSNVGQNPTVNGLTVPGPYTFKLAVTDNNGAQAVDNVRVTVIAAANQPPTANAGNNIVITLPNSNPVWLIGSGSDPDGTIVSYQWTRVPPATPAATIVTPNNDSTQITGLTPGTYTFQLTVTDNGGLISTDNVTVTVNAAPNQPPVAQAGNDITITLPTTFTPLNGSGSDVDGTITTWLWTKISSPIGTNPTFNPSNAAPTTVSGLTVAGTYKFKLTVTDNGGLQASDSVTVIVNPAPNQPPTANAGNNIVITLPVNSVWLYGSGSDPNGTIVSYQWTRVPPTTPAATIGTPNNDTTQITGLTQGTYTFRLTVTDNNGAQSTDDVTVTVNAASPANQPPVAQAGNDITITLPTTFTPLNGSGSDVDGTITTWLWTKISSPVGTNPTFNPSNAAPTTVSGLTVAGTYKFKLTATDNNGAQNSDSMTVTVNPAPNQPPTANAGNNIVITLPVNSVWLYGSGSDPNGTIVSYQWTRVPPTTPAATIGTPNNDTTQITGLTQGTYTFRLTVTDNNGATATDDVTVTVNPVPNTPPIANAGNNIVLTLPVNYTPLNGSASIDPNGTIVSYVWTKISSNPANASLTIVTNGANAELSNLQQGTYIFTLTVTDNNGATNSDNVTVTVNPAAPLVNQAPVVNAGSDIIMMLPANTVTLNGSASDADGTIVSKTWTQISGPTTGVILSSPSTLSTVLTVQVATTYVFRLTVKDNNGATSWDNVTIVVYPSSAVNQPPTARTNNDITITLPVNTVRLYGNTSSDPDGVIVSYKWTLLSGPPQGLIVASNDSITTVSDLTTGIYTFQLKVTDDDGATSTKTVKVTVQNQQGQAAYIRIYPSPVSSTLYLQYVANVNGKFRVAIYDASRRLMKDEIMDKTQVSVTRSFDVSLFGKGMYVIEIVSPDNKIVAKQFVKM